MNKIYSDPIEKAQLLIEGLQKNHSYLQTKGYDLSVIERLQKTCEELAREGEAVAAEEEALSRHRMQCHQILSRLKRDLLSGKGAIKQMFDQEQWSQYGVPDKR